MSGSSKSAPSRSKAGEWPTARTSRNYQRVRAHLVELGHPGELWDSLAFSLGLLPTLFAHGLALQRVSEIFAAPVFLSATQWSKQAWVQELPAWRTMLNDWERVRRTLPRSDSFLDPRRPGDLDHPRKHPLHRFGIDVAPLVSALMVRHDYFKSEDPEQLALAARFDHLQAMFTAAAIDYMWASGATVGAYLKWKPDSRHEFKAFPTESHRACRTVRWLSEAPQAALLESMGRSSDPREFVQELLQWKLAVTPDAAEAQAQADTASLDAPTPEDVQRRTYPPALHRYLSHWTAVLDGTDVVGRPAKTGGGGAGGGGAAVHGFVPPDEGAAAGQQTDSAPAPEGNTAEDDAAAGGGIADEDVAPIRLPLVSVGQIDAISSGQKWRAMRAAMADAVTPFDIRYLSHTDAERVARHAIGQAQAALAKPIEGRSRAVDALLALMTLALGQPPSVLAKTRLAILQPTESDAQAQRSRGWIDAPMLALHRALDLQIDAPLLLAWPALSPREEPPWQTRGFDWAIPAGHPIDGQDPRPAPGAAIGFLLPAIQPNLAGTEADGIDTSRRPKQTVRNLLVPAGITGHLLLKLHLNSRSQPWSERPQVARRPSTSAKATPTGSTPDEAVGVPLFSSYGDTNEIRALAASMGAQSAEQRVTDFLNGAQGCSPPPGHERWSVRLLQDQMPAHVEATSGDRTLRWLLSCDPTGSSQARLYYTQHTLGRLIKAWMRAMHAAGLEVLLPEIDRRALAGGAGEAGGPTSEPQANSPPPAVQLPATWPWSKPELTESRVGAGFVATIEEVRRLVKTLQAKVSQPVALERRSALRAHHRHLLLLTIVYQGLCTALRALRSPVALLRAVEQSDRVRAKAGLPPVDEIFVGLADKESFYNQRARLVVLPPILVRQLRILQSHQIALVARLDRHEQWRCAPDRVRAMFRLDDKDMPAEVSVAWVESELAALGFEWPANFARAFLRTHLLERRCAAADLDALLGHRDAGGGAIGLHSTFDFYSGLWRLQVQLASLHGEIGLKVMPSALAADPVPIDTVALLAPMQRAGPVGRGRSDRPRQQGRVDRLPALWKAIHLRATDDDRRQVALLYRLLRAWAYRGNVLAALLSAPDPGEFAAVRGLVGRSGRQRQEKAGEAGNPPETQERPERPEGPKEPERPDPLSAGAADIILRLTLQAENNRRARFHMASSWFRLLVRARNVLKGRGIEVPEFPVVPSVRPPSSPFVESSVLAIPIVDGWRSALLSWMEKALTGARDWRARAPKGQSHAGPADAHTGMTANTTSTTSTAMTAMPLPDAPSEMAAEGWAAALVMSAVLNGMLLDLTQVGMLLRRFSTPGGRDLPISGPYRRAHLDFHVAAGGGMDRQTHRWWFDPLSELIWLNAPPMPRELRLGDLQPWLRRLALMAFKGSVAMPFEPHSFSDLIRCAEVWWLARASRTVVASQRRQIDASSILTDRWARLVGARRLTAPPWHDRPGDTEQAVEAEQALEAGNAEDPSAGTRKRRRRRASIVSATESAFSQLALVRASGERGLDQSTAWEPAPGDAELLATLTVAHPWIEQVAQALTALTATAPPWDLSVLRQVERPLGQVRVDTLVEFAVWLADPAGGSFTGPPLVRTFTAAAQALVLHGEPGTHAGPIEPQALARIIREVDDLPLTAGATPLSVRQALRKLAQFMQIEAQVLALLDADEREELDGDDQRSHADACVLSFEEYAQVQQVLDEGLYPNLTRSDRTLGRLLLALCFRLGLRPGEAYGLRLRDIKADAVFVLPYGDHQLKSSNARRRVPLKLLMPYEERQRLQTFVSMRLDRGASGDDLLLAQPVTGPAHRQRLDRWVHRVMRDVLLDPGVRLYHARHSLSTWADLALRAVDHPELLRFFENLPQTSAFLRQGEQLAAGLFGSAPAALGRTSFALARVVGHVGPAVIHMHYIHGDDLVRAAVVEREAGRLDKSVWMQLTGLARSTTFALLKGGGFHALMEHARRAAGWRSNAVALLGSGPAAVLDDGTRPADTRQADTRQADGGQAAAPTTPDTAPRHAASAAATIGTSLPEWIAVSRVCEISAVVATGKRTAEQAGGLFGLEPQRIQTLMDSLQRWLPEVAQPGKRASDDAQKGLVVLSLSSETSMAIQRAEAAARALATRDPMALRSDLEFLIRCYDRRDRDFHVRDSASLQRLVRVALALGMTPASTMLMVRSVDPSKAEPRLPSWVRTDELGSFHACQTRCVGVRSAAKADSYVKWLGLVPVTSSLEGCGNAFAGFAALAIAILDAVAAPSAA